MKRIIKKNRHSRYNLMYHLVVVTKYRHKCITPEIFKELEPGNGTVVMLTHPTNGGHIVIFAKDDKNYTDGKSNLSQLVNKIINSNQLNMSQTNEEAQQSYNRGVEAERDRCLSWLAHLDKDQEAVLEGIESGKPISNSQREKFLVKQSKMKALEDLESENADDYDTPESGKGENEEPKGFNFKLK